MQKCLRNCLLGLLSGVSTGVFAIPSTSLAHMSAEQLKQNDGQNDHPAYVALNGYVYDVSKVPQWKNGKHYKGMKAGADLTPNIQLSPHGANIVKQLKLTPIAVYP